MTQVKPDRSHLASFPPGEKWDDWVELDPQAWPRRVEKHYSLVPTICFNCESACGLLAYVDKETGQVAKFEGNPMHPASRGRLCAKGPATINQIHDPDRVLYPMKRSGARGAGKWARTSWDEVLETFGTRIRKAIQEGRGEDVMYHVGRPGHDFIMERTLQAWGIDGHNSHTNVCSSSARLGYLLWHYADRPSPDHAKCSVPLPRPYGRCSSAPRWRWCAGRCCRWCGCTGSSTCSRRAKIRWPACWWSPKSKDSASAC